MSKLRLTIAMSLDGFVAGPDQSVQTRSASAACARTGERLFQGIDDMRGLELVRTVATPKVIHLKFARC